MATDEQLKQIVVAAATLGDDDRRRLSCAQAFALQAEHDASLLQIGAICDDEDIRISVCQLGCFK